MKMKLSTLAFGLLLAVGWTNVAQAQLIGESPTTLLTKRVMPSATNGKSTPVSKQDLNKESQTPLLKDVMQGFNGLSGRSKAPKLAPKRANITADKTMTRAEYEAITYDWVDASGTNHPGTKITEPASDPYQIAYLLGTTYMNPDIPGLKYSEVYDLDNPYPNIDFGWDIPNNSRWNYEGITALAYNDISITAGSSYSSSYTQYALIKSISVVSGNTTIAKWDYESTNGSILPYWSIPSNWTLYDSGNAGMYIHTQSSSATITISGRLLTGYNNVQVQIVAKDYDYSASGYRRIYVNGSYQNLNGSERTLTWDISSSGTIKTVKKPTYNGYTVFLVKVNDGVGAAPNLTYNWNSGSDNLINYFDTYIDEVQLLTDGTRLNEGTVDAGTMFAYSGELNRFYFLGKGNDYWWGSSESDLNPHSAPTYDMYEEFSPTTTDTGANITDFYSKLLYGNSYNVIHDCRAMNALQHYFTMSGKEGTQHRSMTNLVFWIPDNRGVYYGRNYDTEYLPHVGLYTITLEAEAEQVAQNYTPGNRNYEVTCDWVSSLNSILDFSVDQDYELWIYVYDEQGNPVEERKVTDLIVDENGYIHNSTTHSYYVEQKPESYDIIYRIKGWPKDATNTPGKHIDDPENGTFYALSNLAPVTIPGYNNFLSLGVEHYESDFVLDGDPEYAEHNYYRNFLTVANQNPDNALTAKRIKDGEEHFMLYRFDPDNKDDNGDPILTKAADLLFSAANNKVEYLIEYDNQFYVDEANLVHVDDNGNSHAITGYTNPDALGCPTYGVIANISEGSGSVAPIVFDKSWDFEDASQANEWTLIDADGDGHNWTHHINTGTDNHTTHSGSGLMYSESYYNDASTALTPNNWMISPEMPLGGTLKFWACGQDEDYSAEKFAVYVLQGTFDGGTTGFVQVGSDYTATSTMTEYTVNLGRYYGNGRIAIVHHNVTDQFILNIDDVSYHYTNEGYTMLNSFLDNSTYTQEGIVVFQEPWKSIQVKLQEHTGSASGYFVIQNDGRLRFIMPAGYNNANLKFVIHNAPVSSDYFDGKFTLVKKSTGEIKTIEIPKTANYGDRDYEVIFTGMSSGDVISITGTHTHEGVLYNYSPDFQYIHVYVEGGTGGISEGTALNLDAIRFVDQFKAETKDDAHAKRYGYVLKLENSDKESGKPQIPVQHTNSKVDGFYSLNDINADTDAEMVDPVNVMNAEVNMTLSHEPEIYYYTLDRKPSTVNNAQWEAVSKLQRREDDSYMEMFDNLPQYDDQICTPPTITGTPWLVDRFDNHDVKVGGYNSYMSYVPVIWTHGDQKNRRIKWDTEKKHNSYGSPIWKTGVAEVTLTSAIAERQDNISTKWTYGGEECSLYMLDNIEAVAKMPTVNNVKYVPYMFRIFVKSNNHKLRGYRLVAEDEDPNKPGEHFEGAAISNDALQCVWSGYVNDPKNEQYGVTISENEANGAKTYTFHKNKVERTNPQGEWDKNKENAIFASLESLIQGEGENMRINGDDLSIVVRFYYLVEGFDASAPGTSRGVGTDPAGYGVEGEGRTPSPWTAVSEIGYNNMIESVTYVNALGMQSDKPFDGVNIVITRYSNGTTSTTKVIR